MINLTLYWLYGFRDGDFFDNYHLVICSWHTISNEETCLHDSLVILKRMLQNYQKIKETCFLVVGYEEFTLRTFL